MVCKGETANINGVHEDCKVASGLSNTEGTHNSLHLIVSCIFKYFLAKQTTFKTRYFVITSCLTILWQGAFISLFSLNLF